MVDFVNPNFIDFCGYFLILLLRYLPILGVFPNFHRKSFKKLKFGDNLGIWGQFFDLGIWGQL
jgi:hypothetical protein